MAIEEFLACLEVLKGTAEMADPLAKTGEEGSGPADGAVDRVAVPLRTLRHEAAAGSDDRRNGAAVGRPDTLQTCLPPLPGCECAGDPGGRRGQAGVAKAEDGCRPAIAGGRWTR